MGIFRFFTFLSKIWKIREIQKAVRIRDKIDPWPIFTLTLKKDEMKFFHRNYVFLPTK